jgi:hypothetical protein
MSWMMAASLSKQIYCSMPYHREQRKSWLVSQQKLSIVHVNLYDDWADRIREETNR